MNGRRRFLLGTVLSIQNTGFTYPACQICVSRLTHTSHRYQCQKCGQTYQDAARRYRLCVKVAEDQKLHIISAFGSCLERIFGSSADSLHRHLQKSGQPLCDDGWDEARQLLFQAAEDCLLGRSFIFAVKVPDPLPRDGSDSLSHLIACQIIPINDNPAISILNCYHRLQESILSNSLTNSRHELSARSAHKGFWDLADSEGSYGLHQSGKQCADYWQCSLGLASSPTLNTSAESPSCRPSPSNPKEANEPSGEGENTFEESNVVAQSSMRPEHLKAIVNEHPCIAKNSPPRVKHPSLTIDRTHTETRGYNPCSSHADPTSSWVSCRPQHHLQNVCHSGSYGCQDRSACRKHFPSQNMQAAESHQVGNITWDEFPFSESLSEFIARLEKSEEERFHFSVKEIECSVSNKEQEFYEGHSETVDDLIRTPRALLAPSRHNITNITPTKTRTPNCLGDAGSEALQYDDPCEVIQRDSPGSEEASASSACDGLQGRVQKSLIRDILSEDSVVRVADSSYPSLSSHLKTFSLMKENAESKRNFQRNNFPHRTDKNINRYILSVGQHGSSHFKQTKDERLEEEDLSPLGSDNPISSSPEGYNASADLFDNAEEILGETLQSDHTRSLKEGHGKEVIGLQTPPPWESPCTHVIVRRNSQLQTSYWREAGTIHGLLSCLQSTPILRPLSESGVLIGDGSTIRDSILSRRSGHSLTNFLLKNIKQSLSRGRSNALCSISDHFRFYSPISAEMSCRRVLQRRKTWSIKSGKKKTILEDKERRSIRGCDRSGEDRGDGSMVTRHETDPMDITEIRGNASPLMSPFHIVTVQKPLPGDWSPELFTEKSDISKQSDTLQRRLF